MKILNQTNLDELIRRSADRELLNEDLEEEERGEGFEEEGDERQWQAWLESIGW